MIRIERPGAGHAARLRLCGGEIVEVIDHTMLLPDNDLGAIAAYLLMVPHQ